MSTNRCDPEVYEHGTTIFLTHTLRSADVEAWVRKAAELSGQRIDWRWACGRAEVLVLGDAVKAQRALCDLREMHDEAYMRESVAIAPKDRAWSERHCAGIWAYNAETYGCPV